MRDAHGFIKLIDRKKNMIISGGENVYPTEVEAILGQHPEVKDVAVVGVADDKWGERVEAALVLREGAEVNAQDLIDWTRDKLAGSNSRATLSSCLRTKCRATPPVKSYIAYSGICWPSALPFKPKEKSSDRNSGPQPRR